MLFEHGIGQSQLDGGTIFQPGRVRTRKRAVAVGCRRRVDVPRCTSLPAPSTGTTADERHVRRRRSAEKRNKNKPLWLLKSCRLLLPFKGSPYSITERCVPELIPVLGSQPARGMSHKPGDRLPLLSARPVVTLATLRRAAINCAAW